MRTRADEGGYLLSLSGQFELRLRKWKKILVVDDSMALVRMIQSVLKG